MVPGAQATKKKKETQEQALVRMVETISGKLKKDNPDGADQLGWIIGKKDMGSTEREADRQEYWRHNTNAYMEISFPTHLRKDFDALQEHLNEMEIGARIGAGRDLIIIGARAKPRAGVQEEGVQEVIERIQERVLEPKQEEPQPLVPMPAAPRKLNNQEQALMEQARNVIEQIREIKENQYKVGRNNLELFLEGLQKLEKLMQGKKISEPTREQVDFLLGAANMPFWRKYAERRLAPAQEREEPSALPLRGEGEITRPGASPIDKHIGFEPERDAEWMDAERAPGKSKKVLPEGEAMEWIRAQYKRRSGTDYDKNREEYDQLKDAYESSNNLVERLRIAQQIADNVSSARDAIETIENAFKKKFPGEAEAFDALLQRVSSAHDSVLRATKPTMEDLYAWSGNNTDAKKWLVSHQEAVNRMLETVQAEDLVRVLEYVEAAAKSQLDGTSNPRPRPRVVLERASDFPAVRDGISALYVIRGLQPPALMRTKAQRKALRGKYLLVDTGAPELFRRPERKDIFPPADKDGNTFIEYQGKAIYLHPSQRTVIENCLLKGESGYTFITRFGTKSTQIDATGAYLLEQYLREKGWTNIERVEWAEGRRARAGFRILEVPPGYWDRPVASAREPEVRPESRREERTRERELGEQFAPITAIPANGETEQFRRVLDTASARGQFEVNLQKEELERLMNTPGANGAVFFSNPRHARNAANMMRAAILANNEMREVSVQVTRDYLGNVSGAYLRVGELSENAFARRAEAPLVVPSTYGRQAILTPRERADLQDFLNGKSGEERILFRTGAEGKEALQNYLTRIGYPPENVSFSRLIDAEVETLSVVDRAAYGSEVWEARLASVPLPEVEERESVARRGIRGTSERKSELIRERHSSPEYRLWLLSDVYSNGEQWLQGRLERRAMEEGEKREYTVSHSLQLPSDVYTAHSQDYRRMDENQRAYTILVAGGQGFAERVLTKDRPRIHWQNEIAKAHLSNSHLVDLPEGARFTPSAQAEVVKHMLYMHTGPGKMSRTDKEHYPERAARMLAVLSKYRNFDEFADALGNDYAATAFFTVATQLTEEALLLDLSFMTLSPAEQAKKREALFDLMWRSYAALGMGETAPHPSRNPDRRELDACADAFVDYLAGRGRNNNEFVVQGHTFKTIEAIVVRHDGRNVLAVPYMDEQGNIDQRFMRIVGTRTSKRAPEGYTYYEVNLLDEDKMLKVRTPRSLVDSIAYGALTQRYVTLLNPPELEIKEKAPGPEPTPELVEIPINPRYYGERGYVMTANDLYWERLGISFESDKSLVMPNLQNGVLLLHTLSGEMMAEDSRFFIHPPRTRFTADGREDEVVKGYPTFRTYAYSSAYIDFNEGDAVYVFRKEGDRVGSPSFRPANARRYAGMSDAQLKREKVYKIRVGTFNRFTQNIRYGEGMRDQFDKYVMGSWAANSTDLREMSDEERKNMVPKVDPNRHYYVVESSHTTDPPRSSMQVGSAPDIGVTGRAGERAGLYAGSNAPTILIVQGEVER